MPPFTMLSSRSCRIGHRNHHVLQLGIDLADTAGFRPVSKYFYKQCNVYESHIGWGGSRSVYCPCLLVELSNTPAAGLYDMKDITT